MREDVKPFRLGNGFWRDAENGHRDGRASQQSPNGWPCVRVAVCKDPAKGSLGWTNDGSAERKSVLTLALILAFSLGEKEPPWRAFDFSVDRPANPVADFSKRRRTFLLLLGEKAGMREDVKPFSLGNGFWRDAGNGNRDGRAPQQ